MLPGQIDGFFSTRLVIPCEFPRKNAMCPPSGYPCFYFAAARDLRDRRVCFQLPEDFDLWAWNLGDNALKPVKRNDPFAACSEGKMA